MNLPPPTHGVLINLVDCVIVYRCLAQCSLLFHSRLSQSGHHNFQGSNHPLFTTMNLSRRSPLSFKAAMLPPLLASSSRRDEHVKQSRWVSRAFSDTAHAPLPAGRQHKKKTDKQRHHSIGSRRCHFSRLDSTKSIITLLPASKENQTEENGGGARTT